MMDFITWPELLLSFMAILGVFAGITGLMIVIATELTEDGHWFVFGMLLPAVLLGAGTAFPSWLQIVANVVALGVVLAVPWFLAVQRPRECLRPVVAGQVLMVMGTALVAVLMNAHYEHFVK